MFTHFLKTFLLTLAFCTRQVSVAVPEAPGQWGQEGRSERSLSVEQPGHEGPPWAPVVKQSSPHETAVQGLVVHRLWSCLPVLLIIRHL